ncbi:hypothetical protein EV641_103183 [Rhodococcus sp. SMB37]|nr:hypothetical protein EV641_103183 [Rhodococcus sp. SMB37]
MSSGGVTLGTIGRHEIAAAFAHAERGTPGWFRVPRLLVSADQTLLRAPASTGSAMPVT